jgi:pyruvate-ferredoxin/flavodoxin oxidoreductase
VSKIVEVTDADIRGMINDQHVIAHRSRSLSPDRPVLRGSAQNPDVFFQAREACNSYYDAAPAIVQQVMDRFAKLTGRQYHLFDYFGAPDAERVIVMMGSGAESAEECVDYLTAQGEKVGLLKVRLYRPFAAEAFIAALPKSTRHIAVLDRTKEPGSTGEPLYMDCVTALSHHFNFGGNGMPGMPRIIGGRYGLSSKEFTPAMVKTVFEELTKDQPRHGFTVGIRDDVTQRSLDYDASFSTESDDVVRAVFYGLGSDGTVGANKNSIKIIGEGTDNYAQGYFVYDSKKAGSTTVSHLRFGKKPIRSTYLIDQADFVACHQDQFLEQIDMLKIARPKATFLLNTLAPADEVWDTLPREVQQSIVDKQLKFYVIDAYRVARDANLGGRINTIMQTCFFAISGVLPPDEAIAKIKEAIQKTYGAKGEKIVQMNFAGVDAALANLHEVKVPGKVTSKTQRPPTVAPEAPDFVQNVVAPIMVGDGDAIPVSRMPVDGTFPTATACWEKRCIAIDIPEWDPQTCIQCNKCALVCPHAAIRAKVYEPSAANGAPATFKSTAARGKEFKGLQYTIQVAPEDCTGCGLCVEVCPAKNKSNVSRKAINMTALAPLRTPERENYAYFLDLPEFDRRELKIDSVKGSQFLLPLFEYSGACAGCGETPYVKLLSQLFGDRALIANATGCSSIYGGNLPTTPWARDRAGRGPAWCNSLFEDNAEFGMGFRLCLDKQLELARELVEKLAGKIGDDLARDLLTADQTNEAEIAAQRERVAKLKSVLEKEKDLDAVNLLSVADALVSRSVWIVGGDGWAYDIGFGGLDHVLASGRNVNVLVLDTEVYSNTGGQMSKATPMGAVAKFAAAGKPTGKKDLGLIAMSYGNVYVGSVAMGASDNHTVKTFVEAESYDGPSIILAYSHCIAHGINMTTGMKNQKAAVDCGHWPLYRFDPRRAEEGHNPLKLDSGPAKIPFADYANMENRYRMLIKSDPARAKVLMEQAQANIRSHQAHYQELAREVADANAPAQPAQA